MVSSVSKRPERRPLLFAGAPMMSAQRFLQSDLHRPGSGKPFSRTLVDQRRQCSRFGVPLRDLLGSPHNSSQSSPAGPAADVERRRRLRHRSDGGISGPAVAANEGAGLVVDIQPRAYILRGWGLMTIRRNGCPPCVPEGSPHRRRTERPGDTGLGQHYPQMRYWAENQSRKYTRPGR